MLTKNETPFAALAFEQYHRDGMLMGVITCRARYHLDEHGKLHLAGNQKPVLSDEYAAAPQDSGLTRTTDLIAYKPNTDITVLGYTYAPGAQRAPSWLFGLKIANYKRELRCHGPRKWLPAGIKGGQPWWQLGMASAVDRVPIDYHFSQGSRIFGAPIDLSSQENPIGTPLIDPDITPHDAVLPAPLIEHPDFPVNHPFIMRQPQSFAPVAPFWQARMRFTGSNQSSWQGEHGKRPPDDFDYRYYQCSSRGMAYKGFIRGDETVTLQRLTLGGGVLTFQLPSIQPYAQFDWIDGRSATARLNLDGLYIDLREGPPWFVDLTWRGWLAICPAFFKIDLFYTSLNDLRLDDMLICNETGLAENIKRPAL